MPGYEIHAVAVARVSRDVPTLVELVKQNGTTGRHAMTALRVMSEDGRANSGEAGRQYHQLEMQGFHETSPWNDSSPLMKAKGPRGFLHG
jgi:hypothetical protein